MCNCGKNRTTPPAGMRQETQSRQAAQQVADANAARAANHSTSRIGPPVTQGGQQSFSLQVGDHMEHFGSLLEYRAARIRATRPM